MQRLSKRCICLFVLVTSSAVLFTLDEAPTLKPMPHAAPQIPRNKKPPGIKRTAWNTSTRRSQRPRLRNVQLFSPEAHDISDQGLVVRAVERYVGHTLIVGIDAGLCKEF